MLYLEEGGRVEETNSTYEAKGEEEFQIGNRIRWLIVDRKTNTWQQHHLCGCGRGREENS